MESTLISNPVTNRHRARKVRKNKSQTRIDQRAQNPNDDQSAFQWKSEAQQQLYSSKLLQALRRVRPTSSPAAPRGGRAVRETADKVLAVAAKGRTRWSRAILANRFKLKFMKNKRVRTAATGNSRSTKKRRVGILRLKTKTLPAAQRKARDLGGLVPGCRKQPLPVILEEATDYIAALEMQVRAMSTLANLLSGSGSSAGVVD